MNTAPRPYLVIPKLIEQPTWGGTYIVESKHWQNEPQLVGKKIGQSYELYDKSNLSLALSSDDPTFTGELSDNKSVSQQTSVANAISLSELIAENAEGVLGNAIVGRYGVTMPLLLKFTQALGNSFQLHIPDGVANARWKPKPESWYYFEPGLITCGVKKGVRWEDYQTAVTMLDQEIQKIARSVREKSISYEIAKEKIGTLIKHYDPWQFVNLVRVEKGQLLDLSACGIHHSWEEDLATIPLGNVLYEIQLNVMDDVSTLRSFDKGKMASDGTLRPLQIEEYFMFADRTDLANDPQTHLRQATALSVTDAYSQERLLETKYYCMDRVMLTKDTGRYTSAQTSFRHIFVRSGKITVEASGVTVMVGTGHAVFVPAACREYTVQAVGGHAEILISY